MNIVKCVLLIVIHIFAGLVIVILTNKKPTALPGHSALYSCALFILLNIVYNKLLRVNAIKKYWSPGKAIYFFPAAIGGLVIAVLPIATAVVTGIADTTSISFKTTNITVMGTLITLAIVTWEELWFRGVFLNYCSKYIPEVILSLLVGFLFMTVHLLNPQIDLLKSGPALFLAGSFLTIIYFYYRTIWVPIGVHFGNNYLSGILSSAVDEHIFFGTDGYYSSIILLVLFVFFVLRLRRSSKLSPV